MKHINIPIFIPHLGCPNDCVFCDQRTISGKRSFDVGSVDREISAALSQINKSECETEIAFFGGSFTGIDRSLMIELLEKAHKYIESGDVSAIRVSTRPDYIDETILSILKKYGVTDIELGIQSTSDTVLSAARRGHTAECSRRACRAVVNAGFNLIGQMMTGLPASDRENEIKTAKEIVALGAVGARIYPLVVFKGTALCSMMADGSFTPATEDDIISRSADVLDIFDRASVRVLRIGLCAQENLLDGSTVAGGYYHPAMGEMISSELFYKRITQNSAFPLLEKNGSGTIYCPVGKTSQVIGQKKRNINRLYNEYKIKNVKIIEKNTLVGYNILID